MTHLLALLGSLVLVISACGDSGSNDNNENNANNSGSACTTNEDCEGDDSQPFIDPNGLSCETNINGQGYCSECLNDSDCGAGFNCVDRAYCEELPACTTSRDCASDGELVHFACINGGCQFCTDDIECDVAGGPLMCFSRTCVPRANVAAECIQGTCGEDGLGTCPLETDGDGNSIGYMCVP